MKLHKSILLPAAAMLVLGSCSENAWNDHLDGFQAPTAAEGVTTATYVLTAADYSTIASLEANKTLAEAAGESEALAAIGTNGCFATEEQAQKYIPALLATTDKNLPYFTYNNESSVKVSYNVSSALPAIVKGVNAGTPTYKVTTPDYIDAWGDDEEFINAFCPSVPAAEFIPEILEEKMKDATAGSYVVVNYNESSANPDFGGGDTPGPSKPVWSETNLLGSVTLDQNVEIHGIVTAINARGFVLSDKGGSILCYQASGFDQGLVPLYSQVIVKGKVSAYNKGYQIAINAGEYEVGEVGAYTYPAPVTVDGAAMDAAIAATEDFTAKYVKLTGTLSISGNYYNFTVAGAETAQGSFYMTPDFIKSQVEDGQEYDIYGYFTSISGGRYYNICVTQITQAGAKTAIRSVKRVSAGSIVAVEKNLLYQYDGNAWKNVSDAYVLNPADYQAMGNTYGSLSQAQRDKDLPIFLKQNYPYAAEGDTKTLVYTYYANSETSNQAREYVLQDGVWSANLGEGVSQFTKVDGEWVFNPSIVITLPYARNTDPSYTYYMECVNWVYENICVPMGDTSLTSGKYFIDYRGNAEFYSGASAFYGNVDVRASSALSHCPEGYTGYDGLTDDEITLLMKKRFCTEVMLHALEALHPDVKPAGDMEVTFTVNFTVYDGGSNDANVVYKVVGPGQLEYVSTTCVEPGEDSDWK